jgi:hypothetical protein
MTRLARLACCLLISTACAATSIVPMSVEQLTAAAADVVEARAVRSWSSWNAQHSIIYTYTEFAVTSRLKGSLPGSITVKQMGGSAEGYTQSVAGVRRFQDGEDALLFLRPSATNDGTQVIVGLVQGNFRIWNVPDGAWLPTACPTSMPSRARRCAASAAPPWNWTSWNRACARR